MKIKQVRDNLFTQYPELKTRMLEHLVKVYGESKRSSQEEAECLRKEDERDKDISREGYPSQRRKV